MTSRRVRLVFACIASACALLAVLSNASTAAPTTSHGDHSAVLTAVANAAPQVAARSTNDKPVQLCVLAVLLGLIATAASTAWRSVARHRRPRYLWFLRRSLQRRGPPVLLLAR